MLWYLGACQIQIAVPLSFLYSVLLAQTLKLKTGLHWRHRKKGLSWMHVLQRLNGSHQRGICKRQVRTQPPSGMKGKRDAEDEVHSLLPPPCPRNCPGQSVGNVKQGWDWSLPLRTRCQSVRTHTDDHLDLGALRNVSFHSRKPKSLLCLLFGASVERSWI